MKLHEYQAKRLFADAGIPMPESALASGADEAVDIGERIGLPCAIKAQVKVGGRGKAGGITLARDSGAVREAAERIIGMELKGLSVASVLVEEAVDFVDELYLGVTMDRDAGRPVAMVSREGGVDIETVAEETPDAIVREDVDPRAGLHAYQARRAVFDAGVDRDVAPDVAQTLQTLYAVWAATDGTDAEINPLMITEERDVVAVDAVLNVDDDAMFRHPELAEMATEAQAAEPAGLEQQATAYGFDYVRLDGSVGIIGNGAGLVMTTLDLVEHYGGTPANFLDIGGGAKAERVGHALDVVFADENAQSVLFNIFGGITRGDEVAAGINEALAAFPELPKPVVVRLAGTNAAEGMEILDTDRLIVEETLESAVKRAVAVTEAPT